MKVIFLDNDGVICLSNNWGSRHKKQKKWGGRKLSMEINSIPVDCRFDDFDKKAIKILNEIIDETDAEIVVSSDWRLYANLEELGEYYISQGIIKKPIDVTKIIHYTNWLNDEYITNDFPWNRTEGSEQERYFEIKRWLIEHPEVTNWVAVDDLYMGINMESDWGEYQRTWGLENFVHTPKSLEGIKQSGIKEKILKYLT